MGRMLEKDQLIVNTIRALAIDAIDTANSGHPGLPLGAAPMAYVLWKNHVRFDPKRPYWQNRDRFILSAGHGSALLYSLLHVFNYDVSLDDLKDFRQLGSKTPGHPELKHTDGVEITTGPLGQGIASSVGFAIASERTQSKPTIYVICGDGDLMEGISSEASSLAGNLKLDNLIVLFDDNGITIDGKTEIATSEDVAKRYEAYGWKVIEKVDGTDLEAIDQAVIEAKQANQPVLICVQTTIGYGCDAVAGTSDAHGAPLGWEQNEKTKKKLGLDSSKKFYVPDEVREYVDEILKEKVAPASDPDQQDVQIDENIFKELLEKETKDNATRSHSGDIINELAKHMDFLVGGSADLAASNKTLIKSDGYFSVEEPVNRNVAYGIREHAMAAIVNGITLFGGTRAYGSTFLTFADYMKPSIRLAALMEIPSLFIFTHDSIGVGEDGPTHQPIEHLVMLRSIPNLKVFRPADYRETVISYEQMFESKGPSAIALSRQTLPELDIDRTDEKKGMYVAKKEKNKLEGILLASGSELHLALEVQELLSNEIDLRVVSVLSMEVFREQSKKYQEQVLPKDVRFRYAIEAASPMSWYEWIGLDGYMSTMDGYGASGNAKDVFKKFGFEANEIAERIRNVYQKG